MNQDNRNYTLDLIRGISALLVLVGHLRSALFKDFNEIHNQSVVAKAFYFVTGLGHQAVMVFFVLSGFFVGGAILKSKENFNFKYYLIARLSRLWTPLFPILIITFLVDQITGTISKEILNGSHTSIINSGPIENYSSSISTFLSNLFFLQTIYTPVFGTNGPLWSLANEFWYYILFPVVLITLGFIKTKPSIRLFMGVISFVIISQIPNQIFGFFIWLLGILVFYIIEKQSFSPKKWLSLFAFLLFMASLLANEAKLFGNINPNFSDFLIGLAFSLFLFSVLKINLPNILRNISFWLSEISYSLYIIHFPFVMLIYSLFYSKGQLEFSISAVFHFIFWFLLLVSLSYLFWFLFERNTPMVRRKMKEILNSTNN